MVKKLILIVEDNERNRRLIRDVLRFKGYETMESETAEADSSSLGSSGPR